MGRDEITETPQQVYACLCRDCQRLTSSAFSMGMIGPEKGFRFSGIEPGDFEPLTGKCDRLSDSQTPKMTA
jgi:hypothetical protein